MVDMREGSPRGDADLVTTTQARPDVVRRGPARGVYVVAGMSATVLALGVAQLVAALTGPSSAPVVAVGGAFVDRVPPWLKQAAISAFGTHDKQVLITGALVVVLALGGLAGALGRRQPTAAVSVVIALGAVAALAAATRPDAGRLAVLPSVAGALAGMVALSSLLRRLAALEPSPTAAEDPVAGPGPGRRALLASAAVALGGVAAGLLGWFAGRGVRGVEASRSAVQLPLPAVAQPPPPAGVEVGVPGVVPFRVPNADFYRIDTALVVPQVRAQDWRLRIHGLVDREVSLDYATLVASPLIERDVTLMCVSNEVGGDLIGNATWLGLPLGPLLLRAGPHPDADMVLATSVDGFTTQTPLAVMTDGRDAMLAIGMNGQPLPVEHGFPVRVVVPGLYGFVSATKWVVDMKVTRFDVDSAYWTQRGWSPRAPVKTGSRIDVVRPGSGSGAGSVVVAGVAWAQHRGIAAVDVRLDDGAWQPARLGAEESIDTWRQWVWTWTGATKGKHTAAVRATDKSGAVQTGQRADPAPDGATGWHTVTFTVT